MEMHEYYKVEMKKRKEEDKKRKMKAENPDKEFSGGISYKLACKKKFPLTRRTPSATPVIPRYYHQLGSYITLFHFVFSPPT